jgi:glycosyltransferase involved in cell wall biosynthesis
MSEPLVSVIMPVYNCVAFVDEAIESMVNQTYSNLEIFIIDDCSTDGTKEKVVQWATLDIRIKPIYKAENTGPAETRNFAIKMAKGKYLAIMDADDISLPERLEKQVKFMEANLDIGVLGTTCRIMDKKLMIQPQLTHDKIKIGFLFGNQLSHPSTIIRADILVGLNSPYNESFVPAEDYELWVNLLNTTLFANLSAELVLYRLHNNNISKTRKNTNIENEINLVHWRNFDKNITDFTRLNLTKLMKRQYLELAMKEKLVLIQEIERLIKLNKKNRFFNIQYFEILMLNLMSILITKTSKIEVIKLCLRNRFIFYYCLRAIKVTNDKFDFFQCEWRKVML